MAIADTRESDRVCICLGKLILSRHQRMLTCLHVSCHVSQHLWAGLLLPLLQRETYFALAPNNVVVRFVRAG